MLKKIILTFLLLFGIFSFSIDGFADVESDFNDFTSLYNRYAAEDNMTKEEVTTLSNYQNMYGHEPNEIAKNHALKCEAGGCIDKSTFTIKTSNFAPGGSSITGDTAKEKINNTLGTIIQKLMVAMGVLSLLIMTVGAGYMILYHGQDELLSKGKSIFGSGLIALVVALSSYYLVSLVRLILYSSNSQ